MKEITSTNNKPSKITLKVFKKTDKNKNLIDCKDEKDLFNKLNS